LQHILDLLVLYKTTSLATPTELCQRIIFSPGAG
jgi:hypothetical protein